ncbi:MAG: universal stress protein [Nitrosarchaeum sp.]|nr:universal stress protein [Nitrosarchaeum sp.]
MEYDKNAKKILVAVKDSTKSLDAARYAINTAKQYNVHLTIITIIQTEPWLYGKRPYEWGSDDILDQAYSKQKNKMQQILDKIKTDADKIGVKSNSEIMLQPRTYKIATSIIKYCKDNNIDLIIIGDQSKSGLAKMLSGNITNNVMKHAFCPVLVVK